MDEAGNALPGTVLFAVNNNLVFKGDLEKLIGLAKLAGISPKDIDFSPFNLNDVDLK